MHKKILLQPLRRGISSYSFKSAKSAVRVNGNTDWSVINFGPDAFFSFSVPAIQSAQVTLNFDLDSLVTFNLTCLDSTTAILQETNSSFALTSWPMETGSTTTPVTYEAFTNRKEQIWKFVPVS
ncbi:hypothetical protein B0H19DRAFT_1373229 [Mycena capillaripes]|nr:hypothetical protein B0H19DRAFT_1373229 [Mycena capillaripes]